MLADVESSPFRKFERRSKFQRSLSKLSSTDDNVPKPRQYPNPFKRDGEAKRRAESKGESKSKGLDLVVKQCRCFI